ncbi:SET domain protein [Ancylostoma caninum]|uniref:SET domain protein n=1 Tax=Ancylostoma caninum TaxID=29170 RepID=A0A368GYW3_ANCCA|nr:SET domain protein [Ancylostoma caninum]
MHNPLDIILYIEARNAEVTAEQLDYVTQQLRLLNETPYREGLTKLSTRFEIADFFRRKQRIPVQVRDIPTIGGRGVFAKVPLPRDSVVCDYSGPVVDVDKWERWRIDMPEEERILVERYIVEFSGHFRNQVYNRAVLGHDAIYNGTVVLGRLLNHSDVHPNLTYTVHRRGHEILEECVIFKTTRDIEAGEQLLWNYGKDYDRKSLREKCICNECDSALAEESTTELRRTSPQIDVKGPWINEPSLSQEMHGRGGVRPPLRVAEVLLSAAHKADSVGFLLEDISGDALEAYGRSRTTVLGSEVGDAPRTEHFTAGLAIPAEANNLCKLFWAGHTDAFQHGNPAIIMLMKTRKDYRPYIVLLGRHIPADSAKRYGCCVAYIGSEQKVLAVVPQTRSTGDRQTIEEQFSNGTLLNFSELSQEPWQNILNNTDITLSQITDLLRGYT